MNNLEKMYIDTRELEHPEPLDMAMKLLQKLKEQNYLYMLHRKKPVPLLDLAKEHGFKVFCEEDEKNQWHILISKDRTIQLDDLVHV